MKIYEYDVGHMTKMAAMPIYGKTPSKIFFSGTGGPIGLTLTYFYGKVKFCNFGFFIGKSENSGFFRKLLPASDLKFGRYRQLIELKICEYLRSRSFLDLGPRLLTL